MLVVTERTVYRVQDLWSAKPLEGSVYPDRRGVNSICATRLNYKRPNGVSVNRMVPRSFEYFSPRTVNEAIALLKKHGDQAKILAGGMSLIPVMKLRLASPNYLIDIGRLSTLDYVKESGNSLLIGAMTRHHTIEASRVVKQRVPILAETASWIGDPQVRNMGTIGGSLTHADPSGDWGAAMLAVRGEMKLRGSEERVVKADDFFLDMFTSAVTATELLIEIRVPVPGPRSGGAYAKLERKAGDFATVAVAAQIAIDEKSVCTYAGLGLAALGPTSTRAKRAENALVGKSLTASVIEDAAYAASEDAQPTSDPLRGSAEYRKAMAKVFTRRALKLAFSRAKGGK